MSAGKTYAVTATPTSIYFFGLALYVFSSAAGCLQSGIQADCSSKGASGAFSAGSPLSFTPTSGGVHTIAVDSTDDTGINPWFAGDFLLTVVES